MIHILHSIHPSIHPSVKISDQRPTLKSQKPSKSNYLRSFSISHPSSSVARPHFSGSRKAHMTRPLRLLTTTTTTTTTTTSSALPPPPTEQVNSDFVVILAALLCALICFLGLAAAVRCTWQRRWINSATQGTTSNHHQQQRQPNKGLKKKVLRSLPTQPYSSEFKDADCAICLAEFGDGDQLRVLPQCGHGFHVACIDTWLGSHSSCPSCRQILVVGRCKKCGGVPSPAATAPAPAPSTTETYAGSSEVRRKEREDGDVTNRYLP